MEEIGFVRSPVFFSYLTTKQNGMTYTHPVQFFSEVNSIRSANVVA